MNPNNNNPPTSKTIPRLKTIRPTPDVTTIPTSNTIKPKKEFAPIIPQRRKKEDKLDSLLSGPINDLLKDSLTPLNSIQQAKPKAGGAKFRPNLSNKRKPTTPSLNLQGSTPLVDSRGGDYDGDFGFHDDMKNANKANKVNSEFLQQLFHEMEIDPMQPQHPTHLPLVDPRKVLKEYSLNDAKLDLSKKKKELEAKILNGELSDGTNFQLLETNGLDANGQPILKKKAVIDNNQPFHTDGVFLNNNSLFFIQLPISLPSLVTKPTYPTLQHLIQSNFPPQLPPQANVKKSAANTTTLNTVTTIHELEQSQKQQQQQQLNQQKQSTPVYNEKSFIPNIYPGDFPNTLKSLPSGRLGTLKIYKSGKTILQIGSTKFDVSSSDKLKFLEELKCFTHQPHIDIEQPQKSDPNFIPTPEQTRPSCYNLGVPTQHLVAAPIISKLNKDS